MTFNHSGSDLLRKSYIKIQIGSAVLPFLWYEPKKAVE